MCMVVWHNPPNLIPGIFPSHNYGKLDTMQYLNILLVQMYMSSVDQVVHVLHVYRSESLYVCLLYTADCFPWLSLWRTLLGHCQ